MEVTASDNSSRPAYFKYDDNVLLNREDAEFIVQHLTTFAIEQVGSRKWLTQHSNLEKLNLQAHYNTMAHGDEFVMVALTSLDKLGVLIHELLVIEIWKDKVLPFILKPLAEQDSHINLHLVLYQETTIINLLEVILYHREVCESMNAASLLELADYCYRKIVYLNTDGAQDAAYIERSAREIVDMTPEKELKEKLDSMHFGIGVCSLTVLRYLTDYMSDLPLSVMARMLDCHDVIMALVPLVENPPWQRKRVRSGKPVIENYVEGKWIEVKPGDRFKLTKPDAQLRKYLTDILLDQLPNLKDLKWAVEQLVLQVPQTAPEAISGRLIIEQVPELRETLIRRKDWREIAQRQLQTVFSQKSEVSTHHQAQEILKLFEFGVQRYIHRITNGFQSQDHKH